MMKYLVYGKFKGEGIEGILKEGGAEQVTAMKKACGSAGGTLEGYYFSSGQYDYYMIVNIPDLVSGPALSLLARATGLVTAQAELLVPPEMMDEVAKSYPAYRRPAQQASGQCS